MNKTKAMRAHARTSTVSRTVEMPMHRQAIFASTGFLLANQFLAIGRSAAHDVASLPGQMGQASGEGEASGSKQTVGRNSTNTNRSLIDVARRNGDREFLERLETPELKQAKQEIRRLNCALRTHFRATRL
jgi:hypothetical protein